MNEDTKQTKHDDIGVDNLQEDSKEGTDEGQGEVMDPVDADTEEEVNPGLESLQKEVTKDGEESDDQSEEEEEDFDTNEVNENGNNENTRPMAVLASSQLTPHMKNRPKEVVRDVIKDEHTERTSLRKEEHKRPSEDHHGEGDTHGPDKKAPVKAQDTHNTNVIKAKHTERRSSLKKEEHKRPSKEHHGEGDTRGPDKKESIPAPVNAQDTHNTKPVLICAALVAVLAVVFWQLRTEPQPVQKKFNLLDVFRHEMDKVQSSFPSQHKELWRRSRIHLQRHLQIRRPSEPVSLILTAGLGAEKTLGCLAQQLAAAFSTALNASTLDIYGTSKRAQDSDQVKLDIDKALREAFDGGKQAAVIHRFEELPPGSTLIFYRYCDHENAAYKNVFLAFTVLLEKELEVPPNVSLGMVEEMVQDYLKEKFVSSDRTAVFNQMDVDKLSGLWSRISHLILPVAEEKMIEQHGCGGSE